MLQQGPWGKHFGKTAPVLSCISFFFFSLGSKAKKKKKKKKKGKGRGALSVGRREAGGDWVSEKQATWLLHPAA